MLYLHKTPEWLKLLLPGVTWNYERSAKKIYLTFDDGPIPELSPWVLDELAKYRAKATFFYVGDNIRKYPSLFARALGEGHSIGNHTYNHLNGWQNSVSDYLRNVEKCDEAIRTFGNGTSRMLFRPPYGQIKRSQLKALSQTYKVVFWDYLTGDFDQKLSPERCHQSAVKKAINGSIVLYHENVKAAPRIKYSLPRFLEHFSERGFQFCAID